MGLRWHRGLSPGERHHLAFLFPEPLSGNAALRILIVEDAPLIRKMYRLVFSPQKHELTYAENGRQALDELARSGGREDLILLDLRMPDMDGVAFIRALRAEARFSRIPIVLTTVEPNTSDLLKQATALGVAAVVKKPWRPQELRAVVESVLKTALE